MIRHSGSSLPKLADSRVEHSIPDPALKFAATDRLVYHRMIYEMNE